MSLPTRRERRLRERQGRRGGRRPGAWSPVLAGFILGAVIGGLALGTFLFLDRPYLRPLVPPLDRRAPGQTPGPVSEGPEREHRRLDLQDLVSRYPGRAIRQGNPRLRQIALTFDDGPDNQFTPLILDVLKERGVKATFFITGVQAEQFPDQVRRMVREGHAVASHGFTHRRSSTLSPDEIRAELTRNQALLQELAGGPLPRLFRPPYGSLDQQAADTVLAEGYLIILWTVDSLDWRGTPAAAIIGTVTNQARNGAIVLQHSAGGPGVDLSGTVAALGPVIDDLKARGFEFVTVPRLLEGLGIRASAPGGG